MMVGESGLMGSARGRLVVGMVVLAGLSLTPGWAFAEQNSLLDTGRFELGLNTAFVFTSTTVTPEQGDEITQKTTYFNPNAYLGLTIVDNLQLRLLGGFQSITTSVGDVTTQDSGTFTVIAQGMYHVPMTRGFAVYAGLGAGGFFGSTEREISEGVIAINDTNGGLGQLLFGLLSQPTDSLTLRTGLRFDMLFGSEDPTDANSPFQAQSSQNFQALLEISVGFRFGDAF